MPQLDPVELGGTLDVEVEIAVDEVPTDADANPTYTVHGVNIRRPLLSGTASRTGTGTYEISRVVRPGDGFAAGLVYWVLVNYELSSVAQRQAYTFQVV